MRKTQGPKSIPGVTSASSLLLRSEFDLMTQKMLREIKLLEAADTRKNNYKVIKKND